MAIYIPPSRRKARRVLVATAFLAIGVLAGFLACASGVKKST